MKEGQGRRAYSEMMKIHLMQIIISINIDKFTGLFDKFTRFFGN